MTHDPSSLLARRPGALSAVLRVVTIAAVTAGLYVLGVAVLAIATA